MSLSITPQHIECNIVNYNNSFYEDGYLSDSVSNCSYSTIAESEVVAAKIKRHEHQLLNHYNNLQATQNNENSDKYQVVNIMVDRLNIYGENERNRNEII